MAPARAGLTLGGGQGACAQHPPHVQPYKAARERLLAVQLDGEELLELPGRRPRG
jgi:hypothetical protein